jgi:integrase
LAGEWTNTTTKNTLTPLFVQQIPKIQAVILHLQRKGKAESTTETYRKGLLELAKRADLNNTTEVETAIMNYKKKDTEPASKRWKAQLCTAYYHYCKLNNIKWEKPTYRPDEKSIQPPTREKCLMLIAEAHSILSLKLDISMQTGLRPIEVMLLKVKDIHPEQKTITATSVKNCNPRPPIAITTELITRLQTHIIKRNLHAEDKLFRGKTRVYGDLFRRLRNRLATKMQDESIRAIRLYDLRHAYVTNLLRKIQNAEIVSQKMGHKRLNTTQNYIHLLSDTENGEWIVESTTDQKRADELLAQDFTYCLTTPDGYMKFRKRK